MQPLLYLAHRIPYPPNKGDKIRSFHLLRYLSRHYRVYLGSFADIAGDLDHVAALREYCADVQVFRLSPLAASARCMTGLLSGEPLTAAYYRSAALQRWVDSTIAAHGIRKAVSFSSAMTLYLDRPGAPALVADFCDVDSDKWAQYAAGRGWPASSIYGREARTLLAFERKMAARTQACTFVTPAEAELFVRLAPECAAKVHAVGNGVDTEYFAPAGFASPYAAGEVPIVFTGAMDYWPNIDAVTWFAGEVLPQVRAVEPRARFYVVGMNPAPTVSALAGADVVVTGKVPDTRPYLQHARVAVAPLRVARGLQNKVFEAMAMARPVVVSAAVAQSIAAAAPRVDFEVAGDAREYAHRLLALIDPAAGDEMGRRARARVLGDYNWDAQLARFGELLEATDPRLSLTG